MAPLTAPAATPAGTTPAIKSSTTADALENSDCTTTIPAAGALGSGAGVIVRVLTLEAPKVSSVTIGAPAVASGSELGATVMVPDPVGVLEGRTITTPVLEGASI
jgi:hypothetical protein